MKPSIMMRRAMMHIADAITELQMTRNRGIANGATDKLQQIYDWLHVTADTLDQMEEIEKIGDKQK